MRVISTTSWGRLHEARGQHATAEDRRAEENAAHRELRHPGDDVAARAPAGESCAEDDQHAAAEGREVAPAGARLERVDRFGRGGRRSREPCGEEATDEEADD